MNSSTLEKSYRTYFWIGLIGAAVFILLQIIPSFAQGLGEDSPSAHPIPKADAERTAMSFARQQTGSEPLSVHTVHQADRDLAGYLSKEKLNKKFDDGPGKLVPSDTWQVSLVLPQGQMFVDIGMTSGKVISWQTAGLTGHNTESAKDDEIRRQAASLGYPKLEPLESAGNELLYRVPGYAIEKAELRVAASIGENTDGTLVVASFRPKYNIPSSYLAYTEGQERIASRLSLLGNLVPSALLFILAIIYAIIMRVYGSFRRGWAISLVFLGFYVINNLNMLDGLRAAFGARPNVEAGVTIQLIITMVFTFLLALSAYFSLVAGDGLWRSQGRRLWPSSLESGYSGVAWSSMKLAYVLGFMLLGLQTIILIVLSVSTGAWSTVDVTQSPYNLAAPLLMPLLAWCAAIQEEAVYRLFGIGLLLKWLRSPFIASLIPTIIWAFGHVTYPIYPSTTRLIELTIIGLLFCFIFLRFGFMTAVFTHAIMDSVLMSSSLFTIGGAGNILAGIGYIAAPAGVAWIMKKYGERREARPLTI